MLASLINIAALSAGLYTAEPTPISWINNDWQTAKSQALEENKFIAVNVWATWCHTCLAMKNFVFTESVFEKIQSQHVWVALDYDRPKNAEFFAKYSINAFPTFMVIDPKSDTILARWLGSGTAEEMVQFFRRLKPGSDDVLFRAQLSLSNQKYKEAVQILENNLTTEKDKLRRTRLLSAYAEALRKVDPEACAKKNEVLLDQASNNAQGLDYVMLVSYCASSLKEPSEKNRILSKIRDRLDKGLQSSDLNISVDDHSTILSTLSSLHSQLGNDALAHRAKVQQMILLEKAARDATSPTARATYDAHRLSCYMSLGEFAKAEHMLRQTEAALPKGFNTPWRLALLYLRMRRYADGLAAINRAIELGYGPRRVRLFSAKIDLLVASGGHENARQAANAIRKEIASQNKSLIRTSWLDELKSKEKKIQSPHSN